MAFRETVVFKVVVGNAYGVPIPIVGQSFDVSVVIMLSVQFKVDNIPFLFIHIAKVGKIATGKMMCCISALRSVDPVFAFSVLPLKVYLYIPH